MATQRRFPKEENKPDLRRSDEKPTPNSKTQTNQDESEMGSSGPFNVILKVDKTLTSALSICADEKSSLAVLRPLMKALELSCHGIPWIIGVVTIISVIDNSSLLHKFVNLFIGLLVDLIIVGTVKVLARRQRPENNRMDMFATVSVDNFSLPSGHTTRAVFLAIFISDIFSLDENIVIALTVWSVVVSISRVMLGRHHVFDIVLGALIGYLHYHSLLPYYWVSPETSLWLLKPIKGSMEV